MNDGKALYHRTQPLTLRTSERRLLWADATFRRLSYATNRESNEGCRRGSNKGCRWGSREDKQVGEQTRESWWESRGYGCFL